MADNCLEALLLLPFGLVLFFIATAILSINRTFTSVMTLTEGLVRIVAVKWAYLRRCLNLVRLTYRLIDANLGPLVDMADLGVTTEVATGEVVHGGVATFMRVDGLLTEVVGLLQELRLVAQVLVLSI